MARPRSRSSDEPRPAGGLWSVLVREPGVGVTILRLDGTITFLNHQARRMLFGTGAPDPTGRRLDALLPAPLVEERVALFRLVAETREPVIFRHMRRGRQIQHTVLPCDGKDGPITEVLVITRRGSEEPEEADMRVVESRYVDLGPLDVLTQRELEVLALIGEGMSTNEIADRLHRSPRTIEKHRDAIARKLDLNTRTAMAKRAAVAGLELDDAHRIRVRVASIPEPARAPSGAEKSR